MHPLLRVRPAILAALLKRLLGIQRRAAQTVDGLTFFVDPVSHLGGELLSTGTYEPELSKVFRCLVRPGDAVLDVGANEGYFTVLASSLTKGRVVAIEPQSRLREVIQKNLQLNQITHAELHFLALGDQTGTMSLALSLDLNPGAASCVTTRAGWKHETVETTTVDVLAQRCSWPRFRLVKIDCEGFEEPILKGAREFLARHGADFISLDYHIGIVGREAALRIDTLLRSHGYQLSQAGNGCWLYHLPGLEHEIAALGQVTPIGPSLQIP